MEKEVANILLKIKAVELRPNEPFTWVSEIKSPIYCDNRLLMSYPEERMRVVDNFLKVIKEKKIEFDVVAGTATSGIPWASWIAEKLKKPMIYVRASAKEHGKENLVEGKLEKGQKVLVIEDLISTGGSSVRAVEGVRAQGGNVEWCIAIFTYGFVKAEKKFEEAKCSFATLTNFEVLSEIASETGYIGRDEKEVLMKFSKNPQEWGKSMGFD